ncbi:immunoglobulin-like domain-containing protein [Gottfriedia acidiceleris]|uniref:immunoglobulin-like domain-containing protein n=1 Tax=Gottfriedia acidiceleris TaxID=371036 RepID=UPI00300038C4
MKSILLKVGLLATLSVGLFAGKASATETDWATKCLSMGEIKVGENPPYQQINCLLTNAALSKEIPPEVVKAVAEQESAWRQFDENGKVVSDAPEGAKHRGYGIMQVTDEDPDTERLKTDIIYNIEQGVNILNAKYKLQNPTSVPRIPRIEGAGRGIIENWYFPVMAYNGLVPPNSPIFRDNGSRNLNTYQDQVFSKIQNRSFYDDTKLAKYPFDYNDFDYETDNSKDFKFNRFDYTLIDELHESVYLLKKGDVVKVTKDGANLREQPTRYSVGEGQPLNKTFIIDGDFEYTEPDSKDYKEKHYVWFPVKSTDGTLSGYISSAYLTKKKDFVAPIVTGVKNNAFYNEDLTINFDEGTALLNGTVFKNGSTVTNEGKYTLVVQDEESNTTTITFTLDKTKPIFSGAADTIIEVGSPFDSKSGVSVTDNVDSDLTSKIQVSGSVDNQKPGEYQLVYSATDSAGNTATSIRKITVIDSTKPVFSGATDTIIQVGSPFDSKSGVTVTDNVDGDLTSKIQVSGSVDNQKPGEYQLVYSATDSAGNTATSIRKITVIDSTKPVIYGTADKKLNINSQFDSMAGVSAVDNVDGDLTKSIKIAGIVDTKKKGTYTLTYTVSDKAGNIITVKRTITVIDNIPPVIYGAVNKTININTNFNPLTGVTATDNVDESLTKLIKVTGTVNTKKIGTYTLTYTVTDYSGNKQVLTRKITVKDNIKPVINGALPKTIKVKSNFNSRAGVTAKDNVDGDLTKVIKITGTVNTKKKGTYTLTYVVADKAGNKTTVQRKITVK